MGPKKWDPFDFIKMTSDHLSFSLGLKEFDLKHPKAI